jgi:hypothetical protein
MGKGNDIDVSQLTDQLEQAYALIGDALSVLKRDKKKAASRAPAAKTKKSSKALDFSTPIRAFIKKHAGGMSGPKKLALLVAYLTKGDATKQIPLADVEKQWNKMTAKNLLGVKFNRFYTSQAKENDWVTTGKTGAYSVRPSWKDIFGE